MTFSTRLTEVVDPFSGTLGVAARDLERGTQLSFNEQEVFPAASTIKLPILVTTFSQIVAGKLTLETAVRYTTANRTRGSGILKALTPGQVFPLRDVLTLMIIVSDNTATNMVLDTIGIDSVNALMRNLGLADLVLYRKITFAVDAPLAEGTPAAFADLLTRIAEHQVVNAWACEQMIAILLQQQISDRIARYLPFDGDAYEEDPTHHLGIGNKTGAVRGVRNDVGIIFAPGRRRPYVVALMSKGCKDKRFWAENEGTLALAKVSRLVYDEFVGSARGGS